MGINTDPGGGRVEVEQGQLPVSMVELTDSGDNTIFESAHYMISQFTGKSPTIRPNGVISGGVTVPEASGTVDQIDIGASKVNLNGVETTVVAATDIDVERSADVGNPFRKCSVIVTNGGVYDIEPGVVGTAFSPDRGVAGGPPYIPTDAIEVRQIWMNSDTPAVISTDEIQKIPGVTLELAYDPMPNAIFGRVENMILEKAGVNYAVALPAIHTGAVPKKVFMEYYVPQFSRLGLTNAVVPPANSHSTASTQYIGGTLGNTTTSLTGGSFIYVGHGPTDPIYALEDGIVWIRFYPKKFETPYIAMNGKLSFGETHTAGANVETTVTIAATEKAMRVAA